MKNNKALLFLLIGIFIGLINTVFQSFLDLPHWAIISLVVTQILFVAIGVVLVVKSEKKKQ